MMFCCGSSSCVSGIIQVHSCYFFPSTLCRQSYMLCDRKVKLKLSTSQKEVSAGWEQEVQESRNQKLCY